MTPDIYDQFSRLERRIMDAIYRLGEATVANVVTEIDEQDAYDSIRVTMANLEKKGFIEHRREGPRNVYRPKISERKARASAVEHLLKTFFDGSPSGAILGLIDMSAGALNADEIAEIRARIEDVDGAQDE